MILFMWAPEADMRRAREAVRSGAAKFGNAIRVYASRNAAPADVRGSLVKVQLIADMPCGAGA